MNTVVNLLRKTATFACIAMIHMLVSAPIAAASTTGGIAGQVSGPQGAGLPGAIVSVILHKGGPQVSTVTGNHGRFRFSKLATGSYQVTATSYGFHPTTVESLEVQASRIAQIHLTLASASFADTMEISSSDPAATIEANELRESAASDLGEALARMPGVEKIRKGGIANDIVVRGYSQDNITVLIDGARVAGACPNRMDPPAFHLDFAELDRVELAPSPSLMSAQGSLGGMVNVVTKKPGEGVHVDVPVVVGSNGHLNSAATVSYGNESFGVLGGISHRTAEPYEDGAGTPFTSAANYNDDGRNTDAFSVTSTWTRAFFQPSESDELSLSYSRQESDEVLYPALKMDAVYDDTERLVLGYRRNGNDGRLDQLRATVYATTVDHWMTDSLRTTSAMAPRSWGMGTMASTTVYGASVEADVGQLSLGFESYSRRWDAWTEMAKMSYARQHSIPDVEILTGGVSARWSHALNETTDLDIGARIDAMRSEADPTKANTDLYYAYHALRSTSRSDTAASGAIHIGHRLGGGLRISGGLSSTTRSPDPRERYFALKRMGGDWVGNPQLAPPRALRIETNLDWDLGPTVFSLSSWFDTIDDFITLYDQPRVNMVPGVMNTQAKSYTNVDAQILGLTLSGSSALSSHVSVTGHLAYLRGRKDRDASRGLMSRNLAEMPPLNARLAVRWQNPRYFAEIEGVGTAEQDDVDSDLNEMTTPSWAIANLKLGARLSSWRVQITIENLFDRTYHEHFSFIRDPFRSGAIINEPGRRAAVTLAYSL